jgi:predicted nucleic acid-binding protein
MIVVDTSVWIDYFGGVENLQTVWLERELGMRRLALTDLILCEILQGIRIDRQFKLAHDELKKYRVLNSGGERVAVTAARNFRLLRSKGITIRKTIDCLIASFCILEGHTLLHRDRDFDPFEELLGLRVVHPQSQ